MCARVCMRTGVSISVRAHVPVCVRVHMHVCVCVCVCVYRGGHTDTHVCMHLEIRRQSWEKFLSTSHLFCFRGLSLG